MRSKGRRAAGPLADADAGRLALFGWVMFDWATQPLYTLVVTFLFAPYFVNGFMADPALGSTLWAYATGTGELATKLVKRPKDLTTIAKANDGEFPFWRVFDIISGDTPVPGHETTQMPLYSQRMRSQESSGQFPPAHVRVLEVTHYLESIQNK
jgi:hypothetical protein